MNEPAGPVSITEARELDGLRLVVIEGVPSPWTQAAKGILHIKQLPYTLVRRTKEDGPSALEDWTGQAIRPPCTKRSCLARVGPRSSCWRSG